MKLERRPVVLVFEDKVGISDGYKGIFRGLLERSGLGESAARVITRSAYRTFSTGDLLEWSKQRKQPGPTTNRAKQLRIMQWVEQVVTQHEADAAVVMDPALLFIFNPDWNQCTLDRLRGGTYIHLGIPFVISLPVTAWHSKAKAKDIAKLNDGFVEKGDFEEYRAQEEDDEDVDLEGDSDGSMEWHEPVVVPYGRIVLQFDLEKVARLVRRKVIHERGEILLL